MNHQPSNVLVTGGAGFIGSHFVRYLLGVDDDVKIINYDALTYAGTLMNLVDLPDLERHEFIKGDVLDREWLAQVFDAHKIDTVVHFAAESHVDRSIVAPAMFIQTNVLGTLSVLDIAQTYWSDQGFPGSNCRFHYISTDEVYGSLDMGSPPLDENALLLPRSPYAASKASAEYLVMSYFHTYQLPVIITRCSNNYGPYQHPEKLVPTIVMACLKNQPIPIYGDGQNIRDWLYVVDHCAAINLILRQGVLGEIYNVGASIQLTNLELTQKICSILDELKPGKTRYEQLISFVADRPGHDFRYALDLTKINQLFDWRPNVSLEKGLRKTVEFYLGALN